MKSRTLFCVRLPATGRCYDFWVPARLCMREASQLICQAMESLEPEFFCFTGQQTLMYERTGQIQQPEATVAQIGFVNGDRFVII